MKLKAFLFDLDGVLTDTSDHHFQAWKKTAKQFGIDIPDAFEPKLRGISRMKSAEIIVGQSPVQLSDDEMNTFIAEKNTHYLNAIQSLTPNDRLPGVKDIFEYAKRHAIKTALVSASLNAKWVINSLGMSQWFDFIANPRTSPPKPSPKLFLAAAKGLEVTPDECLGFEDAPAGVAGIKAAQMIAIGIGEGLGADYHFPNLEGALQMIQANQEGWVE